MDKDWVLEKKSHDEKEGKTTTDRDCNQNVDNNVYAAVMDHNGVRVFIKRSTMTIQVRLQ